MSNSHETADAVGNTNQSMSRSGRTGLTIAVLIVVSVLFAFVFSPADPISFYLEAALVLILVLGAFWMGLRIGRSSIGSNSDP